MRTQYNCPMVVELIFPIQINLKIVRCHCAHSHWENKEYRQQESKHIELKQIYLSIDIFSQILVHNAHRLRTGTQPTANTFHLTDT